MHSLDQVLLLIKTNAPTFQQPGVITVRPGYLIKDNWPTQQPAIVVIVSQQAAPVSLPTQIGDIPVQIRQATDLEEAAFQHPDTIARLATQRPEFQDGAFSDSLPDEDADTVDENPTLASTKPQLPYTPPDHVALGPVTGPMTITCHASPDAGWPTLRTFLSQTTAALTVGMYDFTSKHILDSVGSSLMGAKTMTITLDNPARNPTADQTDTETLQALSTELGSSFVSARALVRSNSAVPQWIYPNAYHIKVAVRDSKAMWLSSGNWNNSNQPDMDSIGHPSVGDQEQAKKSDRDWHVIIEHPGLAKTYEAFLKHDFDVASQIEGGPTTMGAAMETAVPDVLRAEPSGTFQFHQPLHLKNVLMTITPLLTPDPGVYVNAMLNLLDSARTKLYIQLQYIHPPNAADQLTTLINKVIDKIAAGLDVRIILSQWQLTNGWLERLQAAGVNLATVRIQNGVHNKGFVVDSEKVVLGSQNWSSDGVLNNRDASVIIENPLAAQYYEKLFVHDWTRLAKQSIHP